MENYRYLLSLPSELAQIKKGWIKREIYPELFISMSNAHDSYNQKFDQLKGITSTAARFKSDFRE